MEQRYVRRTVRMESGERLPLLFARETQMPVGIVADYSITFHRGKPISTTAKAVDAIGMFHSWAESRNINLDERFGTGNLFDSDETTALSAALYQHRPGTRDTAPGGSVVGATHGSRTDRVSAYIRWRSEQIVSRMDVSDPRCQGFTRRLDQVLNHLASLKGKSVSTPRGQLTEAQCQRLFEIVRPGSDENPFQKRTQMRNFFILLLHYELGVRRAEPLVIKGTHLHFGRTPTITVIFTPDDPKDRRKDQPSVKTLSRTLPMGKVLAATADRLMRLRHADPRTSKNAKKTPFVVLDTITGNALSLKAADEIFITLRRRFPDDFPPDFAAHHLRRSWNHRFSKACQAAKIEQAIEDHIRRYIMGWSKDSTQPENYNRKWIEEQAFMILLGLQDQITGANQ